MKPFSAGEAGKSISLLNVRRALGVERAALKKQCSADYFYGEDDKLEAAIQSVERPFSALVKRLSQQPLSITDFEKLYLRRFFLLQHLRTEAAVRRTLEMTGEMIDFVGPGIDEARISPQEAAQEAMHVYVACPCRVVRVEC